MLKLGGSLLDWPELPGAFHRWRTRQPPAVDVLVAGGGPIVEALRQLDRVGNLPTETSHWLAVRAMGLTAALAAKLLGHARPVRTLDELRIERADGLRVLDVEQFLRDDAHSADALPCGWEVTSDSIAAHLARRLGAGELVLLKSAQPAEPTTIELLANGGYVDAYFRRAAAGLAVSCVDLRATNRSTPSAARSCDGGASTPAACCSASRGSRPRRRDALGPRRAFPTGRSPGGTRAAGRAFRGPSDRTRLGS